ncbi:BRISC complex subunit Abraxas 2-like isoform X3 [Apostichopus japonicus]|uniref:BRISC complex subunit Abraxas 2-like isoform X3 n=1 Tax=Stichopus japonicus TaxID=307972 RepID=UPI003AB78199
MAMGYSSQAIVSSDGAASSAFGRHSHPREHPLVDVESDEGSDLFILPIENLGDTAQSEYKHGSSLNTESSGSDSYRDILTSHKKDMIDKDGYLQGMQRVKMTNEAIHDRMKMLKDSVVKSEDSVKRLVAEIKMLDQRVIQFHKAVQKEEEPEPPMVSTMEQLPERPPEDLNLEETWEDDETSDRDNKLESQTPVADSDPFSSLIMDIKASISPPS